MNRSNGTHAPPNSINEECCFLIEPVFSASHNNIIVDRKQCVFKAIHVADLWLTFAHQHNCHWSPYNDSHPNVLECYIHRSPDISLGDPDDSECWHVTPLTAKTLHNAFLQVHLFLGDILLPDGWNQNQLWDNYDFKSVLHKAGFPYIPEPKGWKGPDALKHGFPTCSALSDHVGTLQFFSICTYVIAGLYSADTYHYFSNQYWTGYACASPGLVAAHHCWMCKMGYKVPEESQDMLSDNGESIFHDCLKVPNNVLTPNFTGDNMHSASPHTPELDWEADDEDSPFMDTSISPSPPSHSPSWHKDCNNAWTFVCYQSPTDLKLESPILVPDHLLSESPAPIQDPISEAGMSMGHPNSIPKMLTWVDELEHANQQAQLIKQVIQELTDWHLNNGEPEELDNINQHYSDIFDFSEWKQVIQVAANSLCSETA